MSGALASGAGVVVAVRRDATDSAGEGDRDLFQILRKKDLFIVATGCWISRPVTEDPEPGSEVGSVPEAEGPALDIRNLNRCLLSFLSLPIVDCLIVYSLLLNG